MFREVCLHGVLVHDDSGDSLPHRCSKCEKEGDLKTRPFKNIGVSKYEGDASKKFLGSTKFHALLHEIGDLHDLKQKDYGREGDPFANVRAAEEWGIKPWVGAMNRVGDKIKRLQKYAKCGTLSNEGARDSFMDLAVYALIACLLWEEENV